MRFFFISDITSKLEQVQLKDNYHLSDPGQEFERYKMVRKTKELKRQYARFLANLQHHMLVLQKEGTLDLAVIKNQVTAYDRRLKIPMSCCKSVQNIFEKLSSPEYSSFLDYELVKLFVDYGSDKCKSEFIDYKRKLQKFFESRIVEQITPEGEKSYAVVIDESITGEVTDFAQLQNRIKIILGQKKITLLPWENLNLQPKSMVSSSVLRCFS